jgi:hypothetical protein
VAILEAGVADVAHMDTGMTGETTRHLLGVEATFFYVQEDMLTHAAGLKGEQFLDEEGIRPTPENSADVLVQPGILALQAANHGRSGKRRG